MLNETVWKSWGWLTEQKQNPLIAQNGKLPAMWGRRDEPDWRNILPKLQISIYWEIINRLVTIATCGYKWQQCSWHMLTSARGTSSWQSVFPFLFGAHQVSHLHQWRALLNRGSPVDIPYLLHKHSQVLFLHSCRPFPNFIEISCRSGRYDLKFISFFYFFFLFFFFCSDSVISQ